MGRASQRVEWAVLLLPLTLVGGLNIQPDSLWLGWARNSKKVLFSNQVTWCFSCDFYSYLVCALSQCGGLWVARLLTWKLVSKTEKEKAYNPLKSGARRSQEPTHHFFCITNYKATPNLKGRGSGPYLFKGWRWACAYGEGQERW